MTLATTTLQIENPSATSPLRLYTQSLNSEALGEAEYFWMPTDNRAWLGPRSHERVELESGRRFVLAAVQGNATVSINATHALKVTELTLEDDGEWSETSGEPISVTGARSFELSEKYRIAISCHSGNADVTAYLMNRSDCQVQLIRQEPGRMRITPPAPATWSKPTDAGMIAAGGKKSVVIHDRTRIVIESDSKEDVVLGLNNPNVVHGLRVKTLRDKGEANAAYLQPLRMGETSATSIAVNKMQAAIVEQMPT
jgi:hypothetical protein